MIDDEVGYYLDLFKHYESSKLWTDGGISNQPNFYMELMKEIRRLRDTIKTDD